MAETVLERHYRDRVQSVRQLAAQDAGQAALGRQRLDDLVTLCAELAVSGRDLLEKEYRRLFKEPSATVTWLRERRRVVEELSAGFLQLAESVRESVQRAAEGNGLPSDAALLARIEDAIKMLSTARQSVLERWPVGDDQEIAAAQASAAQGQGLDIEEAFAQIAGVPVEEWRRQKAEFKRRRQA